MRNNFWTGKKVLITGHTGFKGSWLSLWLQSIGAEIIGYALDPPTKPNMFEVAHVHNLVESVKGDVRDIDHLQKIIALYEPEIVFHLAAQALVRRSYQNPVETYSTNVMGTVNLLEAIRKSDSVRAAVIITSDKCYENQEWLWGYRETDIMGGHDPYSSSKGCAELIISAYRRSFFSNVQNRDCRPSVASTRAGNVIGGGDWASDRLIPDILGAFMNNNPVVIRNPKATRPWQHVLEPLRGYLMLAEKLWHSGEQFAGSWNFGPNDIDNRSVAWIADQLTGLWNDNAFWKKDADVQPYEANYLKLDCSKAKTLLKWQPILNLQTALEWIVDWYRAYRNNEDMQEITQRQIMCYEKLVSDVV